MSATRITPVTGGQHKGGINDRPHGTRSGLMTQDGLIKVGASHS